MFILPVNVTADIERLMRSYLWCQGEFKRGKAKVNWVDVCKPKLKGGLGIKSLRTWNKALMAKNIWNIVSGKDSIWVRWIKAVKLKDRNFWDYNAPLDACWSWMKILQLRNNMAHFIMKKLGDGRTTSAWYDKWHPAGPLCKFISYRDLYAANFSKKEVVYDLINNGSWNIPTEWVDRFNVIFDQNPPVLTANKVDECVCRTKAGKQVHFTVKTGWSDLCDDWVDVKWARLIWFSQCVHRHSFVVWVTCHNKLKTQDKFLMTDNLNNIKCPFCLNQKDNHNHLFFECDYPKEVWNEFKGLAKLEYAPDSWTEIIDYLVTRPINKSIWSIIQRLLLGACVYFVWQERNLRLYQNKSRPVGKLVEIIRRTVSLKVSSLTIKKSRQTEIAFELWNMNGEGAPSYVHVEICLFFIIHASLADFCGGSCGRFLVFIGFLVVLWIERMDAKSLGANFRSVIGIMKNEGFQETAFQEFEALKILSHEDIKTRVNEDFKWHFVIVMKSICIMMDSGI
ncbi:uncharacterized protein [Rutidosis leptorrhynchoides]|uniref:uncharacterized protein n=1 Tax=Rutidosis leptorrhynchoides TaxID=125765 RepID=UPI003A99C294